METATEVANRRRIGRRVVIGVAVAAALSLLLVVYLVNSSPRTDDASVWANYIEIAPEVSGRVVELPVKDNAFVKKGDLLFVIDPRPYQYSKNRSSISAVALLRSRVQCMQQMLQSPCQRRAFRLREAASTQRALL
jgi:multidrug efflux system membrane fusion protein